MGTYSAAIAPGGMAGARTTTDARWSLAFLGILAYLAVEYTRLPAMFPALLPLQLGKVAVAVSALGWVFSPRSQTPVSNHSRAIDLTVAVLLTTCFFSALGARHQEPAWEGFADAFRWAVIYFLISRITNSPWRLRVFLFVFLLLNFKLAQFGVRTYVLEAASYGEQMAAARGAGAGSTGYFANGGDFGLAMDIVWALSGALLFANLKTKWRLLLGGAFFVFLLAILRSGSRGAVVGAAAVLLASLVQSSRKRLVFPLMALVFLLGVTYVYSNASKDRMKSAVTWERDQTASHRVLLWKAGLDMLRDYPWVGVGPRNFPLVRQQDYPIADVRVQHLPTVAHSVYVESLTELGILGTLPVALLVLWFVRLNARTRKHLAALGPGERKSLEYCFSLGLDLALVGFLVAGAFVSVLWYPHLWILLGLSVALHSVALQRQGQKDATRPQFRDWVFQTNPG